MNKITGVHLKFKCLYGSPSCHLNIFRETPTNGSSSIPFHHLYFLSPLKIFNNPNTSTNLSFSFSILYVLFLSQECTAVDKHPLIWFYTPSTTQRWTTKALRCTIHTSYLGILFFTPKGLWKMLSVDFHIIAVCWKHLIIECNHKTYSYQHSLILTTVWKKTAYLKLISWWGALKG